MWNTVCVEHCVCACVCLCAFVCVHTWPPLLHHRALSQVHPAGGLVPRLLLLVKRRYPLQYFCRTSRQYVTARALAQAQQRLERQQKLAGLAAKMEQDKQLMGRGRKRKLTAAAEDGSSTAVYKWKRERKK